MNTIKKLITLLVVLLFSLPSFAQEYEYIPLVREGVKWVYYYVNSGDFYPPDTNLTVGTVYLTLELKGDTVIGNKTYKVMHKYFGDSINEENDTIPICLREENKIVYGIVPEGKAYYDCPISCYDNSEIYSKISNGEEFILYDFNDPVTFSYETSPYFQWRLEEGDNPFKFSDMINLNGLLAKRYVFGCFGDFCFIEGIGFDSLIDGYLLAYQYADLMSAPIFNLSHVIEGDNVIYRSAKDRSQFETSDGYLSITRPDVKWVNEHVTIHNGDTTCYYYIYEFKPIENNQFDYNCYYSSLERLNPVTDSIISLGRDMGWEFSSIQNKKLGPLMQNRDNLIDFECTNSLNNIYTLYTFDPADISSWCLLNYYIDRQNEAILSRENFVEVEPLEIEGIICSRYAYVKENGDTMCYVVEGIGFDSRDMGDLLTPFTRKPDPNADYQEWCGLSHVIKDGKIIYKGMRYRPNVNGDVNGDGEVTIADANSVTDIVIMGGNAGHTRIPEADVNGDGEVNIADINAIIDMILSQNAKNE